MVESLIENIHREDLTDVETWKFIKQIGKEMGWGTGKITSGIAGEISRAEPKIQEQIGKEALKREEGMRRSEIRELIREPTPEPIELEETIINN